jgi:hypothetical protein
VEVEGSDSVGHTENGNAERRPVVGVKSVRGTVRAQMFGTDRGRGVNSQPNSGTKCGTNALHAPEATREPTRDFQRKRPLEGVEL